MAQEYEQEHSKNQILNQYLNTATYGTNDGRTAVGVEAASEVFFNKHAADLSVKEAALLAGLPQAPTDYNPFLDPHAAKSRRNEVLDCARRPGLHPAESGRSASRTRAWASTGADRYETRKQQYFFDYVQQELIDKYGLKTVRQGGLQGLHDPRPEAAGRRRAGDRQPPRRRRRRRARARLDSTPTPARSSRWPRRQSYDTSQFNLAVDGERQPGSSFKTFVLTTAVDQGMDPKTTTYPAPSSLTLDIGYGQSWPVSGEAGGGAMNLRDALAHSINTVFAQLGLDVGPENFTAMAHKLGDHLEAQGVPAEAIGGTAECCTVLEMSNAYATLANGGVHHKPTAIRKVGSPTATSTSPRTRAATA